MTKKLYTLISVVALCIILTATSFVPVSASVKTNACSVHGGPFEGNLNCSLTFSTKPSCNISIYGVQCGSTLSVGVCRKRTYSNRKFVHGVSTKGASNISYDVKCTYYYNKLTKKITANVTSRVIGYTSGTSKNVYLILKVGNTKKYLLIGTTSPSRCIHTVSYRRLSNVRHQKIIYCKKTGRVISRCNYRHSKNCRVCSRSTR